MLIKALCDYADKQKQKSDTLVIPKGFANQDIHFRIMLTSEGDIAGIVDIRNEEKTFDKKGKEIIKAVPRKVLLPERTQKSGIESNIIEHRPLYIFGLNLEKGCFSPDDNTNRARKSHDAFVNKNLEFFEDLNSEMCIAYRKFIEKWNPENETENSMLLQLGKDYSNSYFGFSLTGAKGDLEDDEQFRKKYNEYFEKKNNADEIPESELVTCGILGERLPISRLHDKIKFPGGNSTGCVLVGMNDVAFESYGKKQSYNSNVSEKAMKKYTYILNTLLSDKKHRTIIGDMVVTYFAMKSNDDLECDAFSMFFTDSDKAVDESLNTFFKFATSGGVTQLTESEIDEDVTFYVVGMTPNSSRICQKFICRDKFGNIMRNLICHQQDLKINSEDHHQIFFSRIAKELVSPKSVNDKISPPLMTGIMLAAFNGTNYPKALLENVVRRVKTDSDEDKKHYIKLNDTRAGIIKACINRELRLKGKKEEITLALNENNLNPAYLCGRLFAAYEKIQQEASGGGLNRTIKDSYFASACARPSSVLPHLGKLAMNHIKVIGRENGGRDIYFSKLVGDIMNGFEDGFPQTLSSDDQGRFIIGYYQQNKEFYKSKNSD